MNKNNLFFTKAISGSAVEDIVSQIETAIMTEKLSPGDKLPSERELQVQFGTGRGTIREALRTLKQKDLLEIKKGPRGGAFIKIAEVRNISESLFIFLKQKKISAVKLIEFRESIDKSIVSLAVSSSTTEAKSNLYEKAEFLKIICMGDHPDQELISKTDRELNIMLASMSHNPLFEWVMNAVQIGFSSYDYALYEKSYYRKLIAENWVETVFSIKEGDIVKALSCIGYHYTLLRKCIGERDLLGKKM